MQSTFESGGTPIRIHQFELATAAPHPAIVFLHGAGGNTTSWPDRVWPLARRSGCALYAPHYFDSTHTLRADLPTIFDGIHVPRWLQAIADTLDYILTRPNVDPTRIVLVGVSLGAFLSLAHAATHPGIRALVDISGGLVEPFASQATSAFPPTLILHGEIDQVVSVAQARALEQRLEALNVPHERHIFPGEDHWFTHPTQLRVLSFIARFLQIHL